MKKLKMGMVMSMIAMSITAGGVLAIATSCGKGDGGLHPEYFNMKKENYNIVRNGTQMYASLWGIWTGPENVAFSIVGECGSLIHVEEFYTKEEGNNEIGLDGILDNSVTNDTEYTISFVATAWSLKNNGKIISNITWDVKVSFIPE